MNKNNQTVATAFPMNRARKGDRIRILELTCGWGVRQHFNQMGIHAGDELVVKRRAIFGGPLLVELNGSQMAMGRGMARQVIVQKLP